MTDRFRHLIDSLADALLIEDSAGIIVEANPAAAALLSCPLQDLVGRRNDFLSAASVERLGAYRAILKGNEHIQSEAQVLCASGKTLNVVLDITRLPPEFSTSNAGAGATSAEPGAGGLYLLVARESSRRDELDRELRLQRAFAACQRGSAIFFISSRHEISRYPPSSGNASVPVTVPESALDWTRLLIVGPECKSALEQAWTGKEVLLPPAWHAPESSAGPAAQRWLKIHFHPLRLRGSDVSDVCVRVMDCTAERIEDEEQRYRDQRTALSLLTEALYHDVNNYLSVILAQASALRLSLPPGQLAPANVSAIIDAAQQTAGLLRRSTDVSLNAAGSLQPLDLNTVLSDCAPAIARIFKDRPVLKLIRPPSAVGRAHAGETAPMIRANPELLNILVFMLARHMQKAFPACRTLILRTFSSEPPYPGAGPGAGIAFEDSGDPSENAREPGTQSPGGSEDSLELALARSIIRIHRGQMDSVVVSNGAHLLEVTFPALIESAQSSMAPTGKPGKLATTAESAVAQSSGKLHEIEPPPEPEAVGAAPDWREEAGYPTATRLRILLADDEENFRTFTGWVLRQNGYDVVTASDGVEAFDRFKEAAQNYCLVILDSYMPRMGGLESYLRMQILRPDLPVLFASGFASGASADALVSSCPGPATVILKPFSSEDLLAAVKAALTPK